MRNYDNYEEQIVLNVRRIMRAIDMYSSQIARQFGLTSPQLICLKRLAETGPTSPGLLAKRVHLSHATVTGIINRLEKKGLIERTRSHEDGRSLLIGLTDPGRSMIRSSPPMLQEKFMDELFRLEPWEKSLILSSLQRITSILSVDSLDAAPVLTTGPVEAHAESVRKLLDPDGDDAKE